MIELAAAVTTALGITKQIREIADNVATAELKLAIAELTEQLADIKLQAVDLATENRELKQKIQDLSAPPEMEYRDQVYFRTNGDGPFCPSCFDSSGNLVRISEASGHVRRLIKYRCNVCQAHISELPK